jgi:hypothetical protein
VTHDTHTGLVYIYMVYVCKIKKVTTTQFPRRLIKEKAEVRQSPKAPPVCM